MILRLLLIFSLSSIGSSFTPEIDLNRCKKETACFIRQSCLVEESTTAKIDAAKTVLDRYQDEPLNDNTCDVILQARSFSAKKYHFMVQVISTDPSVPVTEVKLEQNGVQFRCSYGRATTENTEFQISQFGEVPTEQPNILFCSFILQSNQNIALLFANNQKKVEIVISGQPNNIIGDRQDVFWMPIASAKTCDPEIISTKNQINDTHAFGMVDNTASPITCPAVENLLVLRADGKEEYPGKIMCKGVQWSFERITGDKIETVKIDYINDVQEIIQVYCIIKMCSLCERHQKIECVGCEETHFNKQRGDCATSTCPNGLWRISEGGGLPVEGEMKCDHKAGSQDQKQSVWYFTPKGKSDPLEISKAACAIDAVCLHPNPDQITTITRIGCPQIDGQSLACGVVQEQGSKKDLYCPNGYQLRYQHEDKITDSTNLTCSTITGKYSDDANNIVPDGSEIFCQGIIVVTTTTEGAVVAAASSGSTWAIVGGTVGFIIILAIAGGIGAFFLSLRRKREEILENERLEKEGNKYRAKIANEAAVPCPEVEVERRQLPTELKTKWELRTYHAVTMMGKFLKPDIWEENVYCWDDSLFMSVVIETFFKHDLDTRQRILRHLTAFDEYFVGERQEKQKGKKPPLQFGNVRQFLVLWDRCRSEMFDCPCCWEYMWRFMKMLYENFRPHDDHREISKYMLKLIVNFARPLLNELTYKQRTWENSTDTKLRPLAIRMLLWAEAPDVIAEVRRLADLPLSEVPISVRAVVLQYAARNMGRAETMLTSYRLMIEQGTSDKAVETLYSGTLRQQILYALCAARDETKKGTPDEFKILRQMMTKMFDYSKMDYTWSSYTPLDQLWAIRGAAEFVTNIKPVMDLFIELAPRNLDEVYEKHVSHAVNFDLDEKKKLRYEWRFNVRDLYNLLAELCTMKSQWNELATIAGPMANFVRQDDELPLPLYVNELSDRALNFGNLFARKDVAEIFYAALVRSGKDLQRKEAATKEQDYLNKKRQKKINWSAKHSRYEKENNYDDDDDDE